jgi:hypothetical protein
MTEREEKEARHWIMVGLEMRIDDWRNIYHCKKVPHSAFKKVIQAIGMPPEKANDTDFMAPFFSELQKQRPDLFSHSKPRKPSKSGKTSEPQSSQGCLVCILLVVVFVIAVRNWF